MNYKPTDAEWLRFALADEDEPRYYIQYIYSDGERLIATDGHRLHVVNRSMDVGYYNEDLLLIAFPTEDVDHKFPDIDKVIPKDNHKSINFSLLKTPYYKQYNPARITRMYAFDNVVFNADYLEQACLGFDDPLIHYKDNKTALLIKSDSRMAVVMPIREKP